MLALLSNPIFIQGLGFVAAAVGISAYLNTSDKYLKYSIALATIILSTHLYLLGSVAGAILMFISAVRYIVAAQTHNKWVGIFFVCIHLVAGGWHSESSLDLLPIVSSVNATIAVFFLQGVKMRLVLLISAFLWLIYNGIIGSYAGVLLESFYIVANLLTITRITFKQK